MTTIITIIIGLTWAGLFTLIGWQQRRIQHLEERIALMHIDAIINGHHHVEIHRLPIRTEEEE